MELAKEILRLLAGSLFSVATFTFSTMLAVVSLYTANYTPRAVENFLLDKKSMQTLGIFLGGFIYCILSLFFMRRSENEYLVISATLALLYALLCVYYFIGFVFNVSNYIQVGQLVDRIFHQAKDTVEKEIKYFSDYSLIDKIPNIDRMYQYSINANSNAYIEYINFSKLIGICESIAGYSI